MSEAEEATSARREEPMAESMTRRQAALWLGALAAASAPLGAAAQTEQEPDPWPDLQHIFFAGKPIAADDGIVAFEAPARAEDAALVPMTFSAKPPPGDARRVAKLTLVIDENPVPLAAAFTLGEHAGDIRIATRVRVNSYTNVHVVAELSDGSLHSATRYVKAAGGCSAPMVKSMDEALAALGQMKFRILPQKTDAPDEAIIMIRHPNNSGLQMDQLTRLYTPARYIDKLRVYQGDELVFSMEGGISVSEDPNFRFTFKPNGAKTFRVEAEDTTGKTFSGSWPAIRDGA
jgi:sulfur-oxidizing protein SoxY